MKRTTKSIVSVLVIVLIILIGQSIKDHKKLENNIAKNNIVSDHTQINNKVIKVKRVLTKSTKDFYLEDGDIATEYTDGSYTIENKKTNTYIFQPATLGDWDYQLKNKEELNNIVDTYLNIQNNTYISVNR